MDDVLFLASKLLWALLRPNTLALVLALLGLMLVWRGRRFGRWPLALGLGWYTAVFVLPLATFLTLPLEQRFPRPTEPEGPVAGIVVLGGAVEQLLTVAHGVPALNGAAERMTEAVALALRHPEAKLVFTGGSAAIVPGGKPRHARQRGPHPSPAAAARGRDLDSRHFRQPHAAFGRRIPRGRLARAALAGELHGGARPGAVVQLAVPHAAEPGRGRAAGMGRARRLSHDGPHGCAIPGAVAARSPQGAARRRQSIGAWDDQRAR